MRALFLAGHTIHGTISAKGEVSRRSNSILRPQ